MGSIGGNNVFDLNEERSRGRACVLGIGTAVPPTTLDQATYPDYYFKFTKSEHMVELKKKFARICERSGIKKRYWFTTDEIFQQNPTTFTYSAPSINVRQDLMDIHVPQLGSEAALKAIEDWGRPLTDITHLIFLNSGGCKMPGADYELVKRLGLPLSTKRYMLYQIGCYGGGTVLRIAKDLAENNRDARVLVVCCETSSIGVRGPSEDHIENLVGQAIFGDGAGAVIVGADPQPNTEKVFFEIMKASQNIIPGSDGAIVGQLRESGLVFSLQPGIPKHIAGIAGKLATEALGAVGISDWNDAFWLVHPGGRAILDEVEKELGLKKEKLEATREVLWEYGNLSSASVLFDMEIMRRRSKEKNLSTAGEGLEWGILFGFGPGLTAETVLLRCPIP